MEKSALMLDSLLYGSNDIEEKLINVLPKILKQEEIKIEPDVTIEPIPDMTMPKHEPLIRVKNVSSLQITTTTIPSSPSPSTTITTTTSTTKLNNVSDNNKIRNENDIYCKERITPPPPLILIDHPKHNDLNCGSPNSYSQSTSTLPLIPSPSDTLEPTDLSNKKPENLTCVPEIVFIKDEINDGASDYSNSSDPERLEVDMSQVNHFHRHNYHLILFFFLSFLFKGIEEHSNSTTTSATSPVPENSDELDSLWKTLYQNRATPDGPLSSEASTILRKLITCRKLGMSITPAPPMNMPNKYEEKNTVSIKNESSGIEEIITKSSGRRKQSFPTKAQPEDQSTDLINAYGNVETWHIVKNSRVRMK